jgi:hypothetical protein
VRLIHFLSAALLVATYLKTSSAFFKTAPAVGLIQAGRFSLEVFCLSAICDGVLNIGVIINQPNVIERILMDVVAISVVSLTVMVMSNSLNRRKHGTHKPIEAGLEERPRPATLTVRAQ